MKKQKVLVVDDEASIRTLVRKILQNEYEVYDAVNGVEATQLVKKVKPDIILLDILMPEMDGYSFLGYLNEGGAAQHIPVIIISAVDHMMNKTLGIQMGAAAYLAKPFTSEHLIATVAQCI